MKRRRTSYVWLAAVVVVAAVAGACVPPPDPPTVTVSISSHANGATLDASDGRLLTVSGTVRSSKTAATVRFDDGSGPVDAVVVGTTWTAPLSPAVSGQRTWTVTATAGPARSVKSIKINVVAPPEDETLVRPGVVKLDAAQAATVLSADEDGLELVFSGDVRPLLADATVVLSDPIDGVSEDGLMRRVLDVSYDAVADHTTVVTELASLVDVFARLVPETPPASGLRRAESSLPAGDAACDEFGKHKTVTLPVIPLGPLTVPFSGASGTYGLRMATYFDSTLSIDGLSVGGALTAGFLLCGKIEATNPESLAAALHRAGSDAEEALFGEDSPVSVVASSGDVTVPLAEFPIPPIPLGPVTLRTEVKPKLGTKFSIPPESHLGTEFNVGFVGGVRIDADDPLIVDPIVDGQVHRDVYGPSKVSLKLSVAVGVRVLEAFKFDFVEAGVDFGGEVDLRWRDGVVVPDGELRWVDIKACFTLFVKAGLKLSVGIPGPIGIGVTIVDIGAEADLAPWCPIDERFTIGTAPPPEIQTLELPAGGVGGAYGQNLDASGEGVTWQLLSGGLPPGLSLSPSGRISGVPNTVGEFTFEVQAQDVYRRKTSRTFMVEISAQVLINTTALPAARTGQPYFAELQANYPSNEGVWSLVSGTLPAGLSMSSTGVVNGTSSGGADGAFTVRFAHHDGRMATKAVALPVTDCPVPDDMPPVGTGAILFYGASPTNDTCVWAATADGGPPRWANDDAYAVPPPNDTFDVPGVPATATAAEPGDFSAGGLKPGRYSPEWWHDGNGTMTLWVRDRLNRAYTTTEPVHVYGAPAGLSSVRRSANGRYLFDVRYLTELTTEVNPSGFEYDTQRFRVLSAIVVDLEKSTAHVLGSDVVNLLDDAVSTPTRREWVPEGQVIQWRGALWVSDNGLEVAVEPNTEWSGDSYSTIWWGVSQSTTSFRAIDIVSGEYADMPRFLSADPRLDEFEGSPFDALLAWAEPVREGGDIVSLLFDPDPIRYCSPIGTYAASYRNAEYFGACGELDIELVPADPDLAPNSLAVGFRLERVTLGWIDGIEPTSRSIELDDLHSSSNWNDHSCAHFDAAGRGWGGINLEGTAQFGLMGMGPAVGPYFFALSPDGGSVFYGRVHFSTDVGDQDENSCEVAYEVQSLSAASAPIVLPFSGPPMLRQETGSLVAGALRWFSEESSYYWAPSWHSTLSPGRWARWGGPTFGGSPPPVVGT